MRNALHRISLYAVLLTMTMSVCLFAQASMIEGEWHFYQTDGTTWLFDVKVTNVSGYYESRVQRWNPAVYGSGAAPVGRLISHLAYNSATSSYSGAHYSIETSAYVGDVTVSIVNPQTLSYSASTYAPTLGQSMHRFSAPWFLGEWHYYQTDGTTWLFDVNVTDSNGVYDLRVVRCNTSIYGSNGSQIGRLISRLTCNNTATPYFAGSHYAIETGAYLDEVVLNIINQQKCQYRATSYSAITNQSIIRASSPQLVAQWTFDEGTGDSAHDISGNGNHFRLYNGPQWVTGINGKALQFDGIDDKGMCIHQSSQVGMSALTIEAVINLAQYNGSFWVPILAKWGPGSSEDDAWALDINRSSPYGIHGAAINGSFNQIFGTTQVPLNQWVHIVYTWDGAKQRTYLNGVKTDSASSYSGAIQNAVTEIRLAFNVGNDMFKGKIDEIDIYSKALSPAEVQQRCQSFGISGTQQKLLAHWSFDSTSGNTIYDMTGNGYNASSNVLMPKSSGVIGNAVVCNDTNFKISITNSIGNFDVPKFTLETWLWRDPAYISPFGAEYSQSVFNYSVCGESGSNIGAGWGVQVLSDSRLQFSVRGNPGSSFWVAAESRTALTAGTWYHIAASYDGLQMRIYFNGVLEGTTNNVNGYLSSNQSPFVSDALIAMDELTSGRARAWFHGKLDEMKFYNYALDSSTVAAHYLAVKPNLAPKLEVNLGIKTAYVQPGDEIWVPIFLTNYEDISISACQFALSFDSTIATLMSVSKDSGMAKGSDWLMSYDNAAKGTVNIALGGVQKPIAYGEGELVRCLFKMASPLANKAYTNLTLTNVSIDENGTLKPTVTNGKLIIDNPAILYGDVTGNKTVNVFDAQKILDYVVGSLKLPNATAPNFTTVVADVSGNGAVTSYDAALVFHYSVGLIKSFPVEQGIAKRLAKSSQAAAAQLFMIASPIQGTGTVAYDIVGSNLLGFIAGEFALSCDTNVVDVNNGDPTSPIRGAVLRSTMDSQNSLLKLAITTNDDIDDNSQITLCRILLPLKAGGDPSAGLSLTRVLLNEGRISTNITSGGLASLSPGLKQNASQSHRISLANGRLLLIDNPANRNLSVSICDSRGRVVMGSSIRKAPRIVGIDIASLPAGLYICRIVDSQETCSRPFIISRE
jgi:hypothetical protein